MDVPHLPQQLQADALADALKLQVDEPQLAHPSLHLYALLALHHLRLQLTHPYQFERQYPLSLCLKSSLTPMLFRATDSLSEPIAQGTKAMESECKQTY